MRRHAAGPITLDQKVLDVLALFPQARAVLEKYGLDLCCGGIHSLRDAAEAHGRSPEALLRDLNAAARQEPA